MVWHPFGMAGKVLGEAVGGRVRKNNRPEPTSRKILQILLEWWVYYLLRLGVFMSRMEMPETTTVWQAISRCLMWAVTIVCVCIGLALFRPQMSRRAKLDAQIASLRSQKESMREARDVAAKRLDWLKQDPAYLEAFARDFLDVARDGETVIHFPPATK